MSFFRYCAYLRNFQSRISLFKYLDYHRHIKILEFFLLINCLPPLFQCFQFLFLNRMPTSVTSNFGFFPTASYLPRCFQNFRFIFQRPAFLRGFKCFYISPSIFCGPPWFQNYGFFILYRAYTRDFQFWISQSLIDCSIFISDFNFFSRSRRTFQSSLVSSLCSSLCLQCSLWSI